MPGFQFQVVPYLNSASYGLLTENSENPGIDITSRAKTMETLCFVVLDLFDAHPNQNVIPRESYMLKHTSLQKTLENRPFLVGSMVIPSSQQLYNQSSQAEQGSKCERV